MKLAIKCEVPDGTKVRQFDGKGGRHFRMQEVWFHLGGPYPEKVEIFLNKDVGAEGYLPGSYLVDEDSLYLSADGRLSISPKLKRLKG